MESVESNGGPEFGNSTLIDRFTTSLRIKIAQKEIKENAPERYLQIIKAAEIYARKGKTSIYKLWLDESNPQIKEDLWLVDSLSQVELSKTPSVNPFLKALNTLAYCYSPRLMAQRTHLPESEIREASQKALSSTRRAVRDLLPKAYQVLPVDLGDQPNNLVNPRAIFLLPEDLKKMYKGKAQGLAITQAKAAVVSVEQGFLKRRLSGSEYHALVHEFAHVLRLSNQNQLHYKYLNLRHQQNLEEGCTELLTGHALRLEGNPYPEKYASGLYKDAAILITNALTPKLALAVTQERTNLDDWPVRADLLTDIKQVIMSRFMLGDYELLDRLTTSVAKGRNMASSISRAIKQKVDWMSISAYFDDVSVFGSAFEIIHDNRFAPKPGVQDIRIMVQANGRNYALLPGPMALGTNANLELKRDYKYEIARVGESNWSRISMEEIPSENGWQLRINYLDVIPDVPVES